MDEWAKTTLSVYKYLDRIVGALDNLIKKKCVHSGFINSGRMDAYAEANDIITHINRKIHLINLKVVTEQAISSMKKADREIILLSYVDGVASAKIAELQNISIRSVFRKKNMAIHSFAANLSMLGYSDQKFSDMYGTEHWLSEIYNRFVAKNEEINQSMLGARFIKNVLKEYSQIKGCYQNYV